MGIGPKAWRVLSAAVIVGTLLVDSSAAAAGLWDDIKKRGKMVVATEAQYYPFEFVEGGKIVGYHKDVLDRIIQSWGVQMDSSICPSPASSPGYSRRSTTSWQPL